jgi:uncharacterized protein (DUF2141 family)
MKISKPGYLLAAVLLLIPALVFSGQEKLSLTVEVTGATPGKGQAVCSLFTSADTFLKQPVIKKTKPIDSKGQAVFRIDDLAAGTYAVSIVYDEDSNGKLNTGLFGIPTEPVGVSNNAKGKFGPPSYGDAAFEFSDSRTIRISLGKAKK